MLLRSGVSCSRSRHDTPPQFEYQQLNPRRQEPAKQRRIAIVISTGPAASINDQALRLWQAFFEELRRLGNVEGQNLAVERYSGEELPYYDGLTEVV
jgi:hypothetical protein